MEMIRFYSNDETLEIIAKYSIDKDAGIEAIRKLCDPVMEGVEGVPDPYDILNLRILELDTRMADAGFYRLPITGGNDDECSFSYDIVFNPVQFTTIYAVSKIEPTGDKDQPFAKILKDKIVVGKIITN